MNSPVVIVGGGIGGLATALCLHARGIPARVFEKAPELKPLGVGINLLPHAARVAHQLELGAELAANGVETSTLAYYNKFGQLIWREPRGIAAGYAVPQYSIHRGQLQMIFYQAALARLGRENVVTGATYESVAQDQDGVTVRFSRTRGDGEAFEIRGRALIAADGIHSVARKAMYPGEGPPNFAQRILWRGVSEAVPYFDGRTMIMAGYQHQKFVCYPITARHPETGRSLINWIAELTVPEQTPPQQDWNREVPKDRFAPRFSSWRFDWLDVPSLIANGERVYEYPLLDRDPLPRWTVGLSTLLGDAAHPMFPIGSNGASQAILDAEALANALARLPPGEALLAYEAERRPATAKLVLLNRQNGPEQVMQIAEERAPRGFEHVHDVLSQAELEAIASQYKQTAGFAIHQVNRR